MRRHVAHAFRLLVAVLVGALAVARAHAEAPKPINTMKPPEGQVFSDEDVIRALKAPGKQAPPPAKPKLVPDKQGYIRVGKDRMQVLWTGGNLIAARRPGEYDKAKDVRRPDRFVTVSATTGKIVTEHEIEDPTELARITKLHDDHRGEGLFVHMSPDTRWLRVVDGEHEWDLPVERPLAKYDPQTLSFQRLNAEQLLVSITVDPVNREAVERQKTDKDEIDFYTVDTVTKKSTRVMTLDGQGRPSKWQYADGKLALLRKSKNFESGGVAIEIYELNPR